MTLVILLIVGREGAQPLLTNLFAYVTQAILITLTFKLVFD